MPPPAAAQGMGDVLLTYENEAIFTNLVVPEKDRLPFIVPNNNIRIQCPLALVDANLADAPPETREAAAAFCNYLYTKEAQREFAACGFR
jgi:sulfate transport system substrate-binding protein